MVWHIAVDGHDTSAPIDRPHQPFDMGFDNPPFSEGLDTILNGQSKRNFAFANIPISIESASSAHDSKIT